MGKARDHWPNHWTWTPEGRCGKQGLEAPAAGERLYTTQDRPSMIKEDFKELMMCLQKPDKEGYWWVVVPI